MNTYTMNITTAEVDPPEPKVGSGMILERGRERVLLYQDHGPLQAGIFRRAPLCQWPISPSEIVPEIAPAYFPYLLLSGFRVIREADVAVTQSPETQS